jgi:hypothetical protein
VFKPSINGFVCEEVSPGAQPAAGPTGLYGPETGPLTQIAQLASDEPVGTTIDSDGIAV